MALSFLVDSTPRAHRLKAANADFSISTRYGTFPGTASERRKPGVRRKSMLRIISREQEFLALRADWERLFEEYEYHSYYATFAGVMALWNILEKPQTSVLHVVIDEVDGRIVLIAPLVVRRWGPWKLLKPIGSDLAFSCDILASGTCDMTKVWQAIANSGCSVLRFELLRQDSLWWRLLAENNHINESPTDAAPYLELHRWADGAEYMRTQPKKPPGSNTRWSSLQTSRKRLTALGEVRFTVYSDDRRIREIVEWMMSFKMEWIKDHKLDARQNWMNVTLARAYDAAHTGNLMLCELTVGTTRIAACLNFVTDKCLDGYMMA